VNAVNCFRVRWRLDNCRPPRDWNKRRRSNHQLLSRDSFGGEHAFIYGSGNYYPVSDTTYYATAQSSAHGDRNDESFSADLLSAVFPFANDPQSQVEVLFVGYFTRASSRGPIIGLAGWTASLSVKTDPSPSM
jgi:hypothetical protein